MRKRSVVLGALDRLIVLAVMLLIFEFCAHFAFSLARSSHWLGGIPELAEKLIYLVPFAVFLAFLLLYFVVLLFGSLFFTLAQLDAIKLTLAASFALLLQVNVMQVLFPDGQANWTPVFSNRFPPSVCSPC